MKECSLEEYSSFLKKENVIVNIFCLFFLWFFFLKDFVKFKNKLRTIEPRFLEKIKNNRASFWKHGSYKKKSVIRLGHFF